MGRRRISLNKTEGKGIPLKSKKPEEVPDREKEGLTTPQVEIPKREGKRNIRRKEWDKPERWPRDFRKNLRSRKTRSCGGREIFFLPR